LHVIVEELVTETLVAAAPAKVTLAPAMKPVPDTVTAVPPAVVPDAGLTPLIVGAVDEHGDVVKVRSEPLVVPSLFVPTARK
jgi:hypothetical protein